MVIDGLSLQNINTEAGTIHYTVNCKP